jgi:hypothetical protein
MARDCDTVAASIASIHRQHSAALKRIPGGQEIVEILQRAHGIATRRKPQPCPAPHEGERCPVCSGLGYTLGDAGNWRAMLDAEGRAHA